MRSKQMNWLVVSAIILAGCSTVFPVQPPTSAVAIVAPSPIDLGEAGTATQIKIAIVIKYRNEEQLDAMLANSRSWLPGAGKFLTASQFRARFSPSMTDYMRVIRSLRRAGFEILQTYQNRTIVDARAPAPLAARYFSTEFHSVSVPDAGTRYVNVRPASLPPDIAPYIVGIAGLNNVQTMHSLMRRVRVDTNKMQPAILHAVHFDRLYGPDGGYGPIVLSRAYELPSLSGIDGEGRASGIATDADFLNSDLAAYLTEFRIHRTHPRTIRVLVDGGPPPGVTPDSGETTLDAETIASLAPGTQLYVYEVPPSPSGGIVGFLDLYNRVVSDNKVDTMNTSFGVCELVDVKLPQMFEAIEKQGAAEGITFHSASGDEGSITYGCTPSQGPTVLTPTDTPHNASVGGTTLMINRRGEEVEETAWSSKSEGGGTGGGVSTKFAVPDFQKNVTNVIPSGRNVPDIAFDADPLTGESFYFQGYWQGPVGGTSLASPIFGAIVTELDQMKSARSGWFDVKMYGAWKTNGYGPASDQYFRDITQGRILYGPYKALPGYDQVSGIGALLAQDFAQIFK